MKRFSLENKPDSLAVYRKATTIQILFVSEPFVVDTQEGPLIISPDTVDDWDGGYYVAYPDDGSKPYCIAPAYVRANYIQVEE